MLTAGRDYLLHVDLAILGQLATVLATVLAAPTSSSPDSRHAVPTANAAPSRPDIG